MGSTQCLFSIQRFDKRAVKLERLGQGVVYSRDLKRILDFGKIEASLNTSRMFALGHQLDFNVLRTIGRPLEIVDLLNNNFDVPRHYLLKDSSDASGISDIPWTRGMKKKRTNYVYKMENTDLPSFFEKIKYFFVNRMRKGCFTEYGNDLVIQATETAFDYFKQDNELYRMYKRHGYWSNTFNFSGINFRITPDDLELVIS